MLPISYALRNLLRSLTRTVQLVLGGMLVILLVLLASAFNDGMLASLQGSAAAGNVLIVGTGSEESLERSQIARSVPVILEASVEDIRKELGQPLISPEVHYCTILEMDGANDNDVIFRGVTPRALAVHTQVEMMEGRFPGPDEVMVGRSLYKHLGVPESRLKPGKSLPFGEQHELKISGVFQAPGSMMESELWLLDAELMRLSRRETYSCAILQVDAEGFDSVDLFCKQRLDLEISAMMESDYFRKQSAFFAPVKYITWLTAVMIALAAVFGGLNTMYAAFISRQRELATMQAVGYSRLAVLISLFQEALTVNLIATVLAMTLSIFFLDGLAVSFSTGVFLVRFNVEHLFIALVTAGVLTVLGTMVPAWRCLSPPLVTSLKS